MHIAALAITCAKQLKRFQNVPLIAVTMKDTNFYGIDNSAKKTESEGAWHQNASDYKNVIQPSSNRQPPLRKVWDAVLGQIKSNRINPAGEQSYSNNSLQDSLA